jgi:hypothetical protein
MVIFNRKIRYNDLFRFLLIISIILIIWYYFITLSENLNEKKVKINLNIKDFEVISLESINLITTKNNLYGIDFKNVNETKKDIQSIFKLLYLNKAFLLDVHLIKNIEFVNKNQKFDNLSLNEPVKIKNFQYLSKAIIEYGIMLDEFDNLSKVIRI